jgi:chitinase
MTPQFSFVQHLESRYLLAAQLSIADAAVNEDVASHHISFVISLSEPASQVVTFNYATQDGTAKSGIDYTAKSGQASLAVGATSWVLDVDVSPDSLYEKDETFQVVLSNVSGAPLADGTATGTIRNDDAIPIVRIQPSSTVNEGNSGTTLSGLVATIEGQSEDPVTFSFTTLDGTAQAGVDYVATSGNRVQESSKPS